MKMWIYFYSAVLTASFMCFVSFYFFILMNALSGASRSPSLALRLVTHNKFTALAFVEDENKNIDAKASRYKSRFKKKMLMVQI